MLMLQGHQFKIGPEKGFHTVLDRSVPTFSQILLPTDLLSPNLDLSKTVHRMERLLNFLSAMIVELSSCSSVSAQIKRVSTWSGG